MSDEIIPVVKKEYPDPGRGPVYTGEILRTGDKDYLISLGTEGSEIPPFKYEAYEGHGPFTTKEGIADWVRTKIDKIRERGGEVTIHTNHMFTLTSALDDVIRNGAVFNAKEGTIKVLDNHELLE